MSKSFVTRCPRCGSHSFEVLSTHNHCIDCLYSSDLSPYISETRSYLTYTEAVKLMESKSVHPNKPSAIEKSVEVNV